MTYKQAWLKIRIETLCLLPIVWLGKLVGHFYKLNTAHNIFLFYPTGDIGGSIQVNADIANLLEDKKPLIVFSKRPRNNLFIDRFRIEGVRILDIHKWIDNKLYHFINVFYRGILATWINKAENPIVFGGECIFFYKIVPHLRKDVKSIELCHIDKWMDYNFGFIDFVTQRVFSTPFLLRKIEAQYRQNNLPQSYFSKLKFIDNAVDIPDNKFIEKEVLDIYYIGRGAAEKRVHIIANIASQMHEANAPVKFHFIGDVSNIITYEDYPYCNFYGNIRDDKIYKQHLENADVGILTSLYEGLPLVVMHMMVYGKVQISTAVSGIPDYIFHEENGFLISELDEHKIAEKACEYILALTRNRTLLREMGAKSKAIGIEKFSRIKFEKEYRRLFNC